MRILLAGLILVCQLAAQRNYGSRTIDGDLIIRNGRLIVHKSTTAPTSGDCDALAEVGALWLQTGAPSSTARVMWLCSQTGASSYAWQPVSHTTGTTAPTTCTVGQLFFDTDATAGSNWFGCTATNTWTLLSGAGSGGDVTAASAFGTDNRLIRSDGTGKGVQASGVTVDDSGNISTPGTITTGSGAIGLLGTCVAASIVATPASSNFEFFCDSSNGNRWSSKDSSGATVAYLKTGDASSGGGVGEWLSSLNFGTVLDLSCSDATFTATGLTTGTVLLVVPYSGVGAISAQAWASASDTAKVRVCNSSGGDVSVSGTFTVKAARGYLSGSGTIDFASIPAGGTATATITVTGATTSMGAVPMPPAAFSSGILLTARVTATDTVTLYAANLTDADIDPASGSFTGMVIQ